MNILKKTILLSALLPIFATANIYSEDVAERGGGREGGGMRGDAGRDFGQYNQGNLDHGDQYRRDAENAAYGGYGGYEGGYGGAAVYPTYGYPAGGYYMNQNPFPDDRQENSVYRENQHPN